MSKGFVKEITGVKKLKDVKQVCQRDDRCKKLKDVKG